MPEASVHEDRYASAAEDQIRATAQFFIGLHVNAVAKSDPMKQTTEYLLWPGVTPLRRAHPRPDVGVERTWNGRLGATDRHADTATMTALVVNASPPSPCTKGDVPLARYKEQRSAETSCEGENFIASTRL